MSYPNAKTTKRFSIAIELESSKFHPGDKIKGKIIIQAKKTLKPTLLLLHFEGKEMTQWQEIFYEGITQKPKDYLPRPSQIYSKHAENSIINLKFPVCEWSDPISIGKHIVPFKYTIPKDLPGSISYNRSHITASISYSIKAFFSNYQKIFSFLPIHITQDPYYTENLPVDRPLTKIKNLFNKDKGDCRMNIRFDHKSFQSNRLVTFFVNVDNSEAKVGIKGFSWRLFHLIQVKNAGGRKFISCEQVCQGKKKIGIKSGKICSGEEAVKIDVVFGEKTGEVLNCPIVKGEFIEVAYYVVVYASIDVWGSRFVEKPQVMAYLPIVVANDLVTEVREVEEEFSESVLYKVIKLDKQETLRDSVNTDIR